MTFGRELLNRAATRVVGRQRELEVLIAALGAGRHVLLEGPPGTGKSTVLRAVSSEAGLGFAFVEGNAELTPARLVGHFDPARVLSDGYVEGIFVDGPLVTALRDGQLLYVEEINRIPEETLNVLITVMSEGELNVPRLGRVVAHPQFRLVAAMNPFDAVGTARISGAVYDRVCRIAMDYQSVDDERAIVAPSSRNDEFADKAVEMVRRTRTHSDVRVGSSVRGAVDLVLVAQQLGELRGLDHIDPKVSLDAAMTALSGRIRVREGSSRSAEDIVMELWVSIFGPPRDEGELGKAGAPSTSAAVGA
jgi:MoxR-like ATPase